jgi:archaellum component FlaG (FlaF/FlaG flagellin family)
LVSALNQANEECDMFGVTLEFVVDNQGWRFYRFNSSQERILMKGVFEPKNWEKPVIVSGKNNFTIGDLSQDQTVEIQLKRNDLIVVINREPHSRFLLRSQSIDSFQNAKS